ncbi:universal stress protein [Pendulispora albinea]|uniref:Universal stress protein n=1 Tax=Pendulispora albinea TaxID=2741071 RepID=A0ABZ2LIW5_9BACT
MNLPTHILVPTDFSPTADEALDYAIVLAAKLGASITVVHAYDVAAVSGAHVRANAQSALDAALAKRQGAGVSLKSLLKSGNPLDTIPDVAREIGAELIVMGTHGRQGIARMLLGSVAERVVRTAPCPVLTVAPADPDEA